MRLSAYTPHRRGFLGGLCGCSLIGLAGCVTPKGPDTPMTAGYRPDSTTDEAGLWQIFEKAERETSRSPLRLRDPALNAYLVDIMGRLAGDLKDDMRLYVMRTAQFNANMASNGMMQVWTGLLLRARDEAEVAAVLGHEIGHYIQRHGIKRMRDLRSKADVGAFIGLAFGAAGLGSLSNMSSLLLLSSVAAYSRENEREADDIGIELMHKAGYRAIAASEIWGELIEEIDATPNARSGSVLFATHPAEEERMNTLRKKAESFGIDAGERYTERYRQRMAAILPMMFEDELRLRRYPNSLVLFKRLQTDMPGEALPLHYEGEIYRLRQQDGDTKLALEAFERALAASKPLAETHRSVGLVHRQAGATDAADAAFRRYLALKPDATDRRMIESYIKSGSVPAVSWRRQLRGTNPPA